MDGVTLREYRDRLMALGESGGWVTVDDLSRWVDCINRNYIPVKHDGKPRPQVKMEHRAQDLQAKLDASMPLPVDADGVPCRIGDLLETEEHIPRKAVGYYLADESTPCVTLDFVSPSIEASRLHHVATEPPDSQERIDADASKPVCEYFGRSAVGGWCDGCQAENDEVCAVAKARDLLRRQRELDGAGEQA